MGGGIGGGMGASSFPALTFEPRNAALVGGVFDESGGYTEEMLVPTQAPSHRPHRRNPTRTPIPTRTPNLTPNPTPYPAPNPTPNPQPGGGRSHRQGGC